MQIFPNCVTVCFGGWDGFRTLKSALSSWSQRQGKHSFSIVCKIFIEGLMYKVFCLLATEMFCRGYTCIEITKWVKLTCSQEIYNLRSRKRELWSRSNKIKPNDRMHMKVPRECCDGDSCYCSVGGRLWSNTEGKSRYSACYDHIMLRTCWSSPLDGKTYAGSGGWCLTTICPAPSTTPRALWWHPTHSCWISESINIWRYL